MTTPTNLTEENILSDGRSRDEVIARLTEQVHRKDLHCGYIWGDTILNGILLTSLDMDDKDKWYGINAAGEQVFIADEDTLLVQK